MPYIEPTMLGNKIKVELPDVTEVRTLAEDAKRLSEQNDKQVSQITQKTDWIDVREYGAKGDGITDDTLALKTAIMYAETMKRRLYIPTGVYIVSDTLEFGEIHIFGDGVDKWVPSFPDQAKEESVGTHLRFVGNGVKKHTLQGTSDMRVSGGWRTNGSSTNTENQYYKLLNFMNTDSSGITPASSKLFSVALRVKATTQNWSIRNLRIYPSYDGLNGYNQKLGGLGDEWDVGLYVDNVEFGTVENVQIVGYWRMAATLLSHARTQAGQYEAGAEHNKFIRSMFQGFRGVSIRGGDYFRTTAVTSSTIEIPWTVSNPVPTSSDLSNAIGLRFGTTVFSWTGASQTGDKLTLTGVTPNPLTSGVSVGSVLRNNIYTTGLAGTVFQDCYICGLEHFSGKSADELGLGIGVSIAIEANNARGVRITGSTKIATREQVLLFLLEADDWEISGDLEPASWKKADESSGNTGGRLIATPTTPTDPAVLYPAGNTSRLNVFSDYISDHVDMEPYYTRANTRFSDNGFFEPRDLYIKSKAFPATDIGSVVRGNKKYGVRIQKEDGSDVISISPSGTIDMKNNVNIETGTLSATNSSNLQLRTNTTNRLTIFSGSGNVVPGADNAQTLGATSSRWSQTHSMQHILYPITSVTAVNNSLFIDSADNKLKFKDNTGVVRIITVT
ncbi:glycosyl hydrolase family 28-related protein [Ectobacillus antri]|uniref:glycosyl hydrolase family 28-related protein n=1 Tax=Ectobacillus antri TaxID=2486280 RepID=UPI000F5A705F|nr:glycosyl hydrolase family 28-related protein [Ectobacillus antri]